MSYNASGVSVRGLHIGWDTAERVRLRDGSTVTRFTLRITDEVMRLQKIAGYLFEGVGHLQPGDLGKTLVVDAVPGGGFIDHFDKPG